MRSLIVVALFALFAIAAAAPDSDAAFLKWLKDNGVDVPKIKFADFVETGPGVMAAEDVKSGDQLVRVPRKLFLTSEFINSTKLKDVLDVVGGLNTQYQLCLVLIEEMRNPQSFWKSYFDVLPKTLESSSFFTEDELRELQGSNLLALTNNRNAQLKSNYDEVFTFLFEKFPAIFKKEYHTFDLFKWAISIVWRQSFLIRSPATNATVSAFIPLLDRYNHGPVESSFRLDEATGDLVVSANSPFKKGDQIFVSRGPKSNLELLLDFGYVLEENPNENVALTVRLTGSDHLASMKTRLLELANLRVNGTYFLMNGTIPEDLAKSLRIQLLKDSELGDYKFALDGKAVSLPSELRVFRAILAACNNLLDAYGGSLDDDVALLRTQLSRRVRSAVILRSGEKKVVMSTIVAVSRKWRDILVEGFPEEPVAAAAPAEKKE